MCERGRDKQEPFYPAKPLKITRFKDLPEARRTALLAEKAAHDALPPHPAMDCVWCMFAHYPVVKREEEPEP